MEKKTRSAPFIISFQLDGFCRALELMIQTQEKPGPMTVSILKRLFDEISGFTTGAALQCIPAFDDKTPLPDLLAIAETLRATQQAFLTPEEALEKKASAGFMNET